MRRPAGLGMIHQIKTTIRVISILVNSRCKTQGQTRQRLRLRDPSPNDGGSVAWCLGGDQEDAAESVETSSHGHRESILPAADVKRID